MIDNKKTNKLAIFALLLAIISVGIVDNRFNDSLITPESIACIDVNNMIVSCISPLVYVNASSIIAVGFLSNSTNDVSLLYEMNTGHWIGNETTVPWFVYIYFYNVTSFQYVESIHRYGGAVPTELVQRQIWSTTYNDWVTVEEFTNELLWYEHTKPIFTYPHFIYPNGTVVIRYAHVDDGKIGNKIEIDVCRLIKNIVEIP